MKTSYLYSKVFWFIAVLSLLAAGNANTQDWFDTDWLYRRQVDVAYNGGTVLTYFQVQILLDGSFDFTKAQSDGSDVRITDADGTTLIPFWIETWDDIGLEASIWVKIPTIPISGTTIFLYYGNTAADNTASGDDTFEFFDDFDSSTIEGYYFVGSPQTIMSQSQAWESSSPHTLSVVEAPAEANYTYYGYYGLVDCGGIGMAGSNDLINWTKFPTSGAPPNNPLFTGGGERWPSVYFDETTYTYYMVHTADYCGTSYVVYRESSDGLSWTSPTTLIPQVSGNSNQNPCLFRDPNDGLFYLYWRRRIVNPPNWIMVRSAATVADMATATDIYLLNPSVSLAAPNMLYVDGTYFLSTEYMSSVWNTRIYSSDSPTGPFTELPGNPVLTNGCACLFQTPVGTTLYEYYCKQTGSVWTLDMRTVDLTAGRQIYGAIDEDKWTPSGGSWSAPYATQQDGTTGIVAEGFGVNPKDIQRSSFFGDDYILEGYGKQVENRVWGFGFRVTGANGGDHYQLNIYEDLDGTQNMYLYNRTNFAGTWIWRTSLGPINMNTWYKIKVKVYGSNIEIYFNDQLKTLTPISNSQWASGSVALYVEDDMKAQFNDVRVRKYASTEPIATVGEEQNQSILIDIAVYNTNCGQFEVRLKPNSDVNSNLTNVQFTIKWPESSVNLTDFTSTYGITLQGSVVVDGGFNHAVFASAGNFPIDWTANTEYTILGFFHDFSGTGYADFEIDEGAWAAANNGVYFAELLGLDFTGIVAGNATGVYLGRCGEFKVLLQAPYGGGMMNKGLAGHIPLSQPYNAEPWNYGGLESVTELDPSVVDWVLLELRSNPTTSVEKKAALLLEDGTIVQYNNIVQGVHFDNTPDGSSFYIVVHHRNHMPLMTALSTVFDGTLVDFTDESTCYGAPGAAFELETGIYGMIAGDVNSNGYLSYSGPGNDRGLILARIVLELTTTNINDIAYGYFDEDVLMDYNVKYIGDDNDRGIILTNLGTLTGTSYLNAIYQTPVPLVTTKSEPVSDGPIHIFMAETDNELQVKITSDENILNGIVDNVQFTLSWDNAANVAIAPLLEQMQSDFGLLPQGDAIEHEGTMYLTYVSVMPVELPEPFTTGDEVVLISLLKDQETELDNIIWIAYNDFTENRNGAYYISLLGKDFTGTIKTGALGIQEMESGGISIYPNPVKSGIVHVELELKNTQQINLAVFDVHGKIVSTHQSIEDAGIVNTTLDLQHLSKGIYYIKIESDNINAMKKLIIL